MFLESLQVSGFPTAYSISETIIPADDPDGKSLQNIEYRIAHSWKCQNDSAVVL